MAAAISFPAFPISYAVTSYVQGTAVLSGTVTLLNPSNVLTVTQNAVINYMEITVGTLQLSGSARIIRLIGFLGNPWYDATMTGGGAVINSYEQNSGGFQMSAGRIDNYKMTGGSFILSGFGRVVNATLTGSGQFQLLGGSLGNATGGTTVLASSVAFTWGGSGKIFGFFRFSGFTVTAPDATTAHIRVSGGGTFSTEYDLSSRFIDVTDATLTMTGPWSGTFSGEITCSATSSASVSSANSYIVAGKITVGPSCSYTHSGGTIRAATALITTTASTSSITLSSGGVSTYRVVLSCCARTSRLISSFARHVTVLCCAMSCSWCGYVLVHEWRYCDGCRNRRHDRYVSLSPTQQSSILSNSGADFCFPVFVYMLCTAVAYVYAGTLFISSNWFGTFTACVVLATRVFD